MVRDYLQADGLAGEIYDAPWQDFAANRSSVLSRLRQQSNVDYAFVMDADDVLTYGPEIDIPRWKQGLTADAYTVSIELGPVIYGRFQLCSNRLPFRYRGVLHEFLDCAQPYTTAEAHGLKIVCDRDGARSQAENKYLCDAETLQAALQLE